MANNTLINGLTPEQFALFQAGFLQCSDGSLMRWAPNQVHEQSQQEQSQQDPLVLAMMGLHISKEEQSQGQSQEQSQQSQPLKIESAKRAYKR